MKLNIQTEEKPSKKDLNFANKKISEYNSQFVPPDNYQPLAVFIKDEKNKIIGSITGGTYWNWLCIDFLWIEESQRGKGLGTKLLAQIEKAAKKRGCKNIHVDTHDFQAPKFYKKHGYKQVGKLKGLPEGYNRYLLHKSL